MIKINSRKQIDKVLILLFVILVISVFVQFAFNRNNKLDSQVDSEAQQEQSVNRAPEQNIASNNIVVDFGDGRKVQQAVKANNAFTALESLASSQGYKIVTKQYKYGLMVEEINRVKNTPQKFWSYYINGKPGQIAADRYILSPGEIVEWKYTSAK